MLLFISVEVFSGNEFMAEYLESKIDILLSNTTAYFAVLGGKYPKEDRTHRSINKLYYKPLINYRRRSLLLESLRLMAFVFDIN